MEPTQVEPAQHHRGSGAAPSVQSPSHQQTPANLGPIPLGGTQGSPDASGTGLSQPGPTTGGAASGGNMGTGNGFVGPGTFTPGTNLGGGSRGSSLGGGSTGGTQFGGGSPSQTTASNPAGYPRDSNPVGTSPMQPPYDLETTTCYPVCATKADFGDFVFLGLTVVLLCISLFVWTGSRTFRTHTEKLANRKRNEASEITFVTGVLLVITAIWFLRWMVAHGLHDQDGFIYFILIILKPREFVPLAALAAVVVAGVAAFNFAISLPLARAVALHRRASTDKTAGPSTAIAGLIVGAINFIASLAALYVFIFPAGK